MSGPGYIALEAPQKCELCGKIEETRPYGPKGEQVCFDCGMKDEAAAERRMKAHIFGESELTNKKGKA